MSSLLSPGAQGVFPGGESTCATLQGQVGPRPKEWVASHSAGVCR